MDKERPSPFLLLLLHCKSILTDPDDSVETQLGAVDCFALLGNFNDSHHHHHQERGRISLSLNARQN